MRPADTRVPVAALPEIHRRRSAVVDVTGLGYVGLPLCLAAACGFSVIGFDTDPAKPPTLMCGQTYLEHIPAASVADAVATGGPRISTRSRSATRS